jgi:hypothetical protein
MPQYVMAKALQNVIVLLVGSPGATRKDVCVEKNGLMCNSRFHPKITCMNK